MWRAGSDKRNTNTHVRIEGVARHLCEEGIGAERLAESHAPDIAHDTATCFGRAAGAAASRKDSVGLRGM